MMAISTENGRTPFSGSRLNIEAIQSIVPLKQTNPRQSYKVKLPKYPICGSFQRSFQLVICHKASGEGYYSGYVVAGWFKESLGKSLVQEPIFAGRLRRLESDGDGENLEIVTNDSGVRMIEANIEMKLDEFLDLQGQKEAEADLVFWENINEKNPDYSPLCFVQVTNFKCGGFSIGISCSLLVADPPSILSFINKWSDIHKNIVSSSITPQIPLFYLPNLGITSSSPPLKTHSCKGTKTGQSVTFTIETKRSNLEDSEMYKNLAAWCLDVAEQKLGKKLAASTIISFFLKEPLGHVKIESCTREEVDSQDKFTCIASLNCLRVGENLFGGSNESHASTWINSASADEGFVMVTPLSEDGLRRTIFTMVTSFS